MMRGKAGGKRGAAPSGRRSAGPGKYHRRAAPIPHGKVGVAENTLAKSHPPAPGGERMRDGISVLPLRRDPSAKRQAGQIKPVRAVREPVRNRVGVRVNIS